MLSATPREATRLLLKKMMALDITGALMSEQECAVFMMIDGVYADSPVACDSDC